MAEAVYLLCALTSVVCAWMLFNGYRLHRTALLFWSSLCFGGFALSNVLTFFDLAIMPTAVDLSLLRSAVSLISMGLLIFGLIWESR